MNDFLNRIYTKNDILAQLEKMGAPKDKAVLMHSSLRLIGKVEGGAQTLLDAMIEYFTSEGGLFCVPTHTWGNLKKEIVLDMNDPATCLGAFSNFAAADPRGIRSQNPTHSMVVFGDRAKALEFIKDDANVSAGADACSCYGKLYETGGYVLLVGVAHNRNTYIHYAEESLGFPDRLSDEPREVKVKLASGELVTKKIKTHKCSFCSDVSARFPKYETAFRYYRAITDGFIGNAPTQLCDARIMKDVVKKIYENGEFADPLAYEYQISPKLYY